MIEFDKDEHVIFEIRKHWATFFFEVLILVLLAILPIILISNFELKTISLFIFFYSLWLLILWVAGFIFWVDYYLDVWIVTSKKIIDVEQNGFFSREISFIHLDKIQDITYEIKGMIPSMMNYGNVEVQTAGFEHGFIIKGVPNPAQVQSKLNEALHLKD